MPIRLKAPIFVRILLATLLPLVLIFSLVIVTITRSVFEYSASAAQEKTLSFAQQSANQVRGSFLRVAALTALTAKDLALVAGNSESAREAARNIIRHTLENAPNAYRIRMYFEPGEEAFGTEEVFAHVYYHEDGKITGHPLLVNEEPDADIALPWYDVPLKNGIPYFDSVSHGRFGPGHARVYVATTNYPVHRNGKIIGCIGMGMLYRKSFQFVDKWEVDGSYRLFIVSESGTVLYASDGALINKNIDTLAFDAGFLKKMKDAMRKNTPFMDESHSPVFGKESLISVYPVNLLDTTTRIFMYMDTPTELVYSAANASVRTVLFTFLAGLLLFIGSLFAVTRNITAPIKKITANADLIARGRLDVPFQDYDENQEIMHEVDSLEHSLHTMLKEIEESNKLKILALQTEYEKKKLEETAAAKDRFFANMSHEIRTPMNVILGISEILLMEDLTNGQKKYAYDIKVSAESLLEIINDILDLSRLESGELPLLPEHYDFKALMENICSLARYLVGKNGLAFTYEQSGAIPHVLYGDDGRLRQVLLNVLGNAIKFTKKGAVTLRVIDKGETLNFEIADTGVGIKDEDMPYLFEPFKQVDSQKNRHIQGTGLGLSICRNLLELMGGSITVDSEYGKGSTFRVTIPKVYGDPAKVREAPDALPVAFNAEARVLVVDDSVSNLKVAQEFLKKFGITVDVAASGAQCLDMLGKTHYDLIFMDHMMPEMDGIKTTAQIRALGGRFAEVPIIALSANAVIGSRELFLSSGMNDFLAKPIEKPKLQAILAKWMPGNLTTQESRYASRPEIAAGSGKAAESKNRASAMLARAAELEELDIQLGLKRVADNRKLYADLLRMFVDSAPKTLETIEAALWEKDARMLTIETHKIKGALAYLGATDLAAHAADLEKAARDEEMRLFLQRFSSFRPALEVFAHRLREILSSRANGEPPAESQEGRSFEDGLRDLRDALAGFNYEKSQEVISDLLRFHWGEEGNKALEAIRLHIKYFDYEAALDGLNRYFPKLR